jgi:hypothetical protein
MYLRFGTTDVPMPMPQWGYEVKISMPFTITKLSGGCGYSVWNNGTNFDIRTLKCEWFLSAYDTDLLVGIFQDKDLGRAANITIKLGASPTGFYPAGPDKGDINDFVVRLTKIEPKASIGHPQDYFNVACEFVHVGSWPSGYTIPDAVIDGSLQIGTIGNLRYPQNMHVQKINYGVSAIITSNASAYINDQTAYSDEYECALDLSQNQANAARLINHMTGTVRSNTVDIIPPANSYLFGIENESTATYTCQWPQKEILIVHRQFNQFDFSLNFSRVSQA